MIIIIESEVASLVDTLAGEIINISTGYEYYTNGELTNLAGKQAPKYPTYTVGNRVINIATDNITIYKYGRNNTNDDLTDLRNALTNVVKAKSQKLTIALAHDGIEEENSVMSCNFATIRRTPSVKKPTIVVYEMQVLLKMFEDNVKIDASKLFSNSLSAIVVIPAANMIKCPHRSRIMDLTPDLLTVYDNATRITSSMLIFTEDKVQFCHMFSDFYREFTVYKYKIGAIDMNIYQLDNLDPAYLQPVEHWPTDSDLPEYRADVCTQCKSRLFEWNYAMYFSETKELCAFCPMCVHYTALCRYTRCSRVYTFKYPRTALDMLELYIREYPANEHPFLRALAQYGHRDNYVSGPDITYAIQYGRNLISDIRETDAHVIYGPNIVVSKI